jgi:hypothetical protein
MKRGGAVGGAADGPRPPAAAGAASPGRPQTKERWFSGTNKYFRVVDPDPDWIRIQ